MRVDLTRHLDVGVASVGAKRGVLDVTEHGIYTFTPWWMFVCRAATTRADVKRKASEMWTGCAGHGAHHRAG